jgi:hypothetical protein
MLGELQRALEVIYGVTAPARVEDFLLPRAALARLGQAPGASEALLVRQHGDELDVALYVSPEVMARLPSLGADGARGFLDGLLPDFSTATEGVSHFVYLTLQALLDRTVSLLELEVQAEVDKFATALLHLWKHGERRLSPQLRSRLFEQVGYRSELSAQERERYGLANRLARGYARFLDARFVAPGGLEGLLRELRRSYRLRSAEKLEYLGARG